ncbi:TPA: hypothetical protein ACGFAU_004514 [Yersinia enterocolitica]|uniref:phage neck terminator protein n=1 Tax=Yersinia TaxID=629 RepID=UPI001F32D59B|nr:MULTISPECIES: hypothetical protein [Yersinia]
MAATITPLMGGLFTSLRSFLIAHVTVTSCRQAQLNRTAMPTGDFIVMTPLGVDGLSTNAVSYQFDPDNDINTETHNRTTVWRCQLDFYGDSAQEFANTIAMIVRSDYSCEWFRRNSAETGSPLITPLFCTDPKQTAMINGEDQWENRWTCDLHAQIPASVVVPQQFMESVSIGLVEIDAKFPPENA